MVTIAQGYLFEKSRKDRQIRGNRKNADMWKVCIMGIKNRLTYKMQIRHSGKARNPCKSSSFWVFIKYNF